MKKTILYVVIILLWIPFWFILGPVSVVYHGLAVVIKAVRAQEIKAERKAERREQAIQEENARRRKEVKELLESNKRKTEPKSKEN